MIALILFLTVIIVSFIFIFFIFLLAILACIPDFIVFVKDGIEEMIEEWEKLPRRLR